MLYKFSKKKNELEKTKVDISFLHGFGVYETIGIVNQNLLFLNDHMNRLKKNLDYLKIPIRHNFKYVLTNLLINDKFNKNDEGYIRLVVTENNEYYEIHKKELRYEEQGVKICIINDIYQNEMGFVKSIGSIGNKIAKKIYLDEKNYYEGIFKNRNGYITEGIISNVFFIKNDKIHTPELSLNILPGVTRTKIIEICKKLGKEVIEGKFKEEDLLNADSIFITNSLMKYGVVWANEINEIKKTKDKMIKNIEAEFGNLTL